MKSRVTERFFWAVPDVDLSPDVVHMELQDPMGPVTYFACKGEFYTYVIGLILFVKKKTIKKTDKTGVLLAIY